MINLTDISTISLTLDMIEHSRIGYDNRIRQFTRNVEDSDGINRGFGLSLFHPAVEIATLAVGDLKTREKANIKLLEKAMKDTPFSDWVAESSGVGLKASARLLAAIGDPAWNAAENRPRRNVSELWAYCGMHPEAKRVKGKKANWNMVAGKRLHIIVDCIVKMGRDHRYRVMYDTTKSEYKVKFPNKVDSGRKDSNGKTIWNYSDGHLHNMALRRVKKEILKDLYNIAKEQHEINPIQQLIGGK